MKKSSLPQDRASTHDMRVAIIAMSASQTRAPAIAPLSSILDTLFLPEPRICKAEKVLEETTNEAVEKPRSESFPAPGS